MKEKLKGLRKKVPRAPEHIREMMTEMQKEALHRLLLEAKKSGFSANISAHSTRRGCVYCSDGCIVGQYMGMAPGIRSGHLDCVLMAYHESRLVLHWSAAKMRRPEHLARSLSVSESWDKTKAARAPVRPMEAYIDPRENRECFGQWNMVSSRCDCCAEFRQCKPYTKALPSLESKVFEKGKDKWPTLAADHEAAIEEAMKSERAKMVSCQQTSHEPSLSCFGRYSTTVGECITCGYRVTCRKTTDANFDCMGSYEKDNEDHDDCRCCEDADECKRITARRDVKEVAFTQIYGGQPSKVAADCGIDVETAPMDEWQRPHKNDDGCMCDGHTGAEDVCERPGCSYKGHRKLVKKGDNEMAWEDEMVDAYSDKDAVITRKMVRESQKTEEHVPVVNPGFFSSCDCFKPQRIAVLVMTPSARPSEHCVRELDRQLKYDAFMQEQWEKLAAEKLKEWKVENSLNLPRCPEHEGRWGLEGNQEVQVSLEAKIMRVNHKSGQPLRWMRYLWLVCPGAPKGADKRSKPVL